MSHCGHMCHFVSLHISQGIELLTMVNKLQKINSTLREKMELDTNCHAKIPVHKCIRSDTGWLGIKLNDMGPI